MTDSTAQKLTVDELGFSFPESKIRELKNNVCPPVVGQDRAVSAIRMGLGMTYEGYNIFIMGAPGTGRRTVLSFLLQDYKPNPAKLQDIAYAYNFARAQEPVALFFPAGKGRFFKALLKKAVERIPFKTLSVLKSKAFLTEQKKITAAAEHEENALLAEFEAKMQKNGFRVLQSKGDAGFSFDLYPVFKKKQFSLADLQNMAAEGKIGEEEFNAIRNQYYLFVNEMSGLFDILRDKWLETDEKIKTLKRQFIKPVIKKELKPVFAAVRAYKKEGLFDAEKLKKILTFLTNVKKDLAAKMHVYSKEFKSERVKKAFIGRYTVNLLCDTSAKKDFVITENAPSFTNLFGTIESSFEQEERAINSHLKIRAGAVHRALGGYLVLQLQDLLEEDDSWVYLKRVLQSGQVEVRTPPSGSHSQTAFKPEALPADFKVIIVGGEYSYDVLYQEDAGFYKLFKVCAEFDSEMPATDENAAAFLGLTERLCTEKNFLPLSDSGYAGLIMYAAALTESRHLLTTRFAEITSLLAECDFFAKSAGKTEICGEVLSDVIEKRRYLHSLPEEKFANMVRLGEIFIEPSGMQHAKITGLAVEERGYHTFGVPVAVTAQASPGTGGIINIEREAGLSGEIYDKAHLIITSLLRRKFSENTPLSLSAGICFEQSYSYIDGDSASCAEFLALVSAIGGFPMRQDIAVTGSLNQHGAVQPVGGISEKIEGFFNTCRISGLTGTQGVMIPYSNKDNLFLSKKVLDACTKGLFSIWVIKTIDEGIRLLSGLEPEDYTERVKNRLNAFYERVKEVSLKKGAAKNGSR